MSASPNTPWIHPAEPLNLPANVQQEPPKPRRWPYVVVTALALAAGAWYLRRAFQHWEHQKKPAIFALAEYNAGASRARRWANNDPDTPISEQAFRKNIDFPSTRSYVTSVLQRYQFYRKRGRM